MKNGECVLELPSQVHALWLTQQALAKHYEATGLKFTLDGRLVGDIAEALALDWFTLKPPKKRTKGVDALTVTGKTVQVKATGQDHAGPAFTPGEGCAEHLLFFRINFKDNTASVAYNGPEAPIRDLLPKGTWSGTKRLSLERIQFLAAKVSPTEMIPLRSAN
jgi:hypothetical protein